MPGTALRLGKFWVSRLISDFIFKFGGTDIKLRKPKPPNFNPYKTFTIIKKWRKQSKPLA
jgi:hypothetical protein